MRKINLLVLHWVGFSSNPNQSQYIIDMKTGDELFKHIRDGHKAKGWSDIGYHYVVAQEGKGKTGQWRVYDGRNDSVVGAHAYGFNSNSLGINVAYGTYLPPEAVDVVVQLLADLCKTYDIKPSKKTIVGHRDLMATECPGELLQSRIPQIIIDVHAKMNGGMTKILPKPVVPDPMPPEDKQIGTIKVTCGDVTKEVLRLNSQTFLHVSDLKALGLISGYDYDSKTDEVKLFK